MQFEISDGTLELKVQRNGEFEVTAIDFITVNLLIGEIEDRHALKIEDGLVKPTTPFLVELAKELEGQGIAGCTPTMAWQLWIKVRSLLSTLKKNLSTPLESPTSTESIPSN